MDMYQLRPKNQETHMLQNSAVKIDQTKNKNTHFIWKTLAGKITKHAMTYHYKWEEYYDTREDKSSTCYQYVATLSLFYDYLRLYIGANNPLSWQTQIRVVHVLRLAQLSCCSPFGLLSIVQHVNIIWSIFNNLHLRPKSLAIVINI
jgi:hypothetical protein